MNMPVVLECIYRSDEGECILENKPCNGCIDAPHFIDLEAGADDDE